MAETHPPNAERAQAGGRLFRDEMVVRGRPFGRWLGKATSRYGLWSLYSPLRGKPEGALLGASARSSSRNVDALVCRGVPRRRGHVERALLRGCGAVATGAAERAPGSRRPWSALPVLDRAPG